MDFSKINIWEMFEYLFYAAAPTVIFSIIGGAVAYILIQLHRSKKAKQKAAEKAAKYREHIEKDGEVH